MKGIIHFMLAGILAQMAGATLAGEAAEHDPAEIAIGERLFLETRFAQANYARPGEADPVMDKTVTTAETLPGPFAGKTINCRSCHMVDEHAENPGGGMRTYTDYARRSPIPNRGDNNTLTGRNSMSLVNIALPRAQGELFHFDGEFNSMDVLVRATLTGRNYGWKPAEHQQAIKHIASIVRGDDGSGELAREFGGSYRKILKAGAKDIPAEFRLPEQYRVDIDRASDREILDVVAKLITAYVSDLNFAMDEKGRYIGSPYDQFLELNNLPRMSEKGESLQAYGQRLLEAVNQLAKPKFISGKGGEFKTHRQAFEFGEQELRGMKLFFSQGGSNTRGGNCAGCHAAPHFSDFGFHNTGLTQLNYDGLHGQGAFTKLDIPDLKHRKKNYDRYLPATTVHPKASSRFRSAVAKDKPGATDLGLWSVFANPDMPAPQAKLGKILCEQVRQQGIQDCNQQTLLTKTIAAFKTPVLRDLGHSFPYMHTGQINTLNEAASLYIASSALARAGQLRNTDPALQHINITGEDIEPLVAFLKSLNEDYD